MVITSHQPGIPIQRLRYRFSHGELFNARIPTVPTAGVIHMSGDSCHIFNDTGFFPCFELKIIGFRVSLITHLGNHPWILLSCFHYQLRLKESAAQRFLHINVFPFGHRQHYCREVGEVGCSNSHCLYLISHLVKHLPEVFEPFCVREFSQRFLGMFPAQIHIAQCHHVGQARFIKIVDDLPTPVADAYMSQVYFFIGADNPVVACCIHFC